MFAGIIVMVYAKKKIPKTSKKMAILRKEFLGYGRKYIYAIVFFYVMISLSTGLAYKLQQDTEGLILIHQDIGYQVGEVFNSIKWLMCIGLFIVRIQDPVFEKMMRKKFCKKRYLRQDAQEDDLVLSTNNSVVGDLGVLDNVAEELKQAYTRTIVWFLGQKYSQALSGVDSSGFTDNQEEDFHMYKLESRTIMNIANTQDQLNSCEINVYAPGKMREVYHSANLGFDFASSFDLELNREAIEKSGTNKGGASGELFFFSHDNKVIFKTINVSESEVFVNMLKDYTTFMKENPNTMIGRIYGFLKVQFQFDILYIVVMENLQICPKDAKLRLYDMKGSTYGRRVIKGNYDEITN